MVKRYSTAVLSLSLLLMAGCLSGRALYLPGSLARPIAPESGRTPAGDRIAVIDFTQAETIGREIGRDYSHARPILWMESPGREMADLVAATLSEKGYKAIRVDTEGSVPPNAVARVSGRVVAFQVDVRKNGLLKAEAAAHIILTVSGSGPGAPAGWSGTVTADYWYTDPVEITPAGVREAANGAANAAAEEAVRRLSSVGILPALPPAPSAPGG